MTRRCKKLPEEGGDSVLHLLGNGRADGEAEAEGDQVDVGAQLVAQSANLDADLLPNLTTSTGFVAQSGLDARVFALDHCTFETVITGRVGQSDLISSKPDSSWFDL